MGVPRATLGLCLIRWVMIPGLVLVAAGCARQHNSWTDEALLHDGRTIEVQRTVIWNQYWGGKFPDQFELTATNPDTGQSLRWTGAAREFPLVLEFRDKVAYLVLKVIGRTLGKYGCPEIPFVFLRYDDRARRWAQVPVSDFPRTLRRVNLSTSYEGYWRREDEPQRRTKEDIAQINRSSEGSVPTDFASWTFSGKNRYRLYGHSDDGCRHLVPSNKDPAHPQSPGQPSQEVQLEILGNRGFDPAWVPTPGDWSAMVSIPDSVSRCWAWLKAVSYDSPDTPELRGWLLFVNDATRRNKARPTGPTLCDTRAIWFPDYGIEPGRVVLSKFTTTGDFLYRLSFEKPSQPEGYRGVLMAPSFHAENGFLFFDWAVHQVVGNELHVKSLMKCRVREPGTG